MKITAKLTEIISSKRDFVSKHFQRRVVIVYSLRLIQTCQLIREFNSVKTGAFFEVKQVGDGGAIGILLSTNYLFICSV